MAIIIGYHLLFTVITIVIISSVQPSQIWLYQNKVFLLYFIIINQRTWTQICFGKIINVRYLK